MGLLYNGIEAFRGKRCSYWVPVALAVALLINNFGFSLFVYEPRLRIFNLAPTYDPCVRALLIRIEPAHRLLKNRISSRLSLY